MPPDKTEDAQLDKRLDDICEGLTEAIDREVERRRREGSLKKGRPLLLHPRDVLSRMLE